MTNEGITNNAAQKQKREPWLPLSTVFAIVILGAAWVYTLGLPEGALSRSMSAAGSAMNLEDEVLPGEGVVLPIRWEGIGRELVRQGVVDEVRFRDLYEGRGGMRPETAAMLAGAVPEVRMTRENAGELLNLFWALGLANKNRILEEGPMQGPEYGGAGGFASTGGWTLAAGDPMAHYSAHALVTLSPEAQARVERVAQGIYRPCCGNSTYFPDCNHGMAMLGLLELMAVQGVSEEEMYRVALRVNAYWFPETYLTIASYMKERRGVPWRNVVPREVLGADYSSAAGFRRVQKEVTPVRRGGGGGCSA